MCRVMLPAALWTENTREGVTSASVVLSEKLCVENQTKPNPTQNPNPNTLMLWSMQESQGFSVAESEEAVAGTRTMGGL